MDANRALEQLREGNRRFAGSETVGERARVSRARRVELTAGQSPFAVVLGCSDSRVPAELVFDQGLGDLFVIRVAGNIAAPTQIGSVEFAVEVLGARLVVVLGHSGCGAVSAAVETIRSGDPGHSPHLRAIVDRIRPAVEGEPDAERAVRANVEATVARLSAESPTLAAVEGLRIVGAEYALESGLVTFFEG